MVLLLLQFLLVEVEVLVAAVAQMMLAVELVVLEIYQQHLLLKEMMEEQEHQAAVIGLVAVAEVLDQLEITLH